MPVPRLVLHQPRPPSTTISPCKKRPRHFLANFGLCLESIITLQRGLVHDGPRLTLIGDPLSNSATRSRAVGRDDSSGDKQCIATRSRCWKLPSMVAGSGTLESRMPAIRRLLTREFAQSTIEDGSFRTSMAFLPLRISRANTPKLNISFFVLSLLGHV